MLVTLPVRTRSFAVAGVLAAALAACSTGTVAADDVASQVSDQLGKKVGRAPESVDCPEDLDAEVGATTECTLTDGDTQLGVTVEVTEVDGSNVSFDIQVDDQPQ